MTQGRRDPRDTKKDDLAQKRLKDRLVGYLRTEIKNSDQIVQSVEVTAYMKQKHNEYTRRESRAFERQIKGVIESLFAEVNTTNIRKSFYKKKDLLAGLDDPEDEAAATGDGPIFDSHGEELMEHTSKNAMNELILANAKKAGGENDSTLGKRSRAEGGTEGTDGESVPKKRKKPASYGSYLQGKD